jgi:hypothetical protein
MLTNEWNDHVVNVSRDFPSEPSQCWWIYINPIFKDTPQSHRDLSRRFLYSRTWLHTTSVLIKKITQHFESKLNEGLTEPKAGYPDRCRRHRSTPWQINKKSQADPPLGITIHDEQSETPTLLLNTQTISKAVLTNLGIVSDKRNERARWMGNKWKRNTENEGENCSRKKTNDSGYPMRGSLLTLE